MLPGLRIIPLGPLRPPPQIKTPSRGQSTLVQRAAEEGACWGCGREWVIYSEQVYYFAHCV